MSTRVPIPPDETPTPHASGASTCSPVRRVTFKAFVEVLDKRTEVEFTLTIPPAFDGASEYLMKQQDMAMAQWVIQSSMKSGIERVSSHWEHTPAQ